MARRGGGGGGGLSGPALFDAEFRQAFLDWLVRARGKTLKSAQEYFYQLGDVTKVCTYAVSMRRQPQCAHAVPRYATD